MKSMQMKKKHVWKKYINESIRIINIWIESIRMKNVYEWKEVYDWKVCERKVFKWKVYEWKELCKLKA